jgi:CheY-like chemotaxis protein
VTVAKVLLVDDEAEVRTVLRRQLTKLGHEVCEAPDGAEALRLLGGGVA